MLLATLLLMYACAMAQPKTPTEAQCREMVNGMIQTMKSTPFTKESDRQGSRVVIERVEKIVRENRSLGISECESWAAIAKIVTTQ